MAGRAHRTVIDACDWTRRGDRLDNWHTTMAKTHQQFLCSKCGSLHVKWMGKCPDCGGWDTLQPFTAPAPDARRDSISGRSSATADLTAGAEPKPVGDIEQDEVERMPSGIGEFDRILGGGIVPGSATLIGGDPGIGKSTLLLQAAGELANRDGAQRILYITSEESAKQTAMRARRLSINSQRLLVLAETNVQRIVNQIHKVGPAVAVIDSIQMIYKPDIPAAPGSVTQLRECCMDLVYLAKSSGIAVIFVGHVTKEGTLAGPKLVEHIVDTVAYFEGDRFHTHRILRCMKNRFGSTSEVGLFEMTGEGLQEVTDPGSLFVESYGGQQPPSGSVLTAATSGSRVLLLEVQALTAPSVIGAAKRKTSGVSADRVAMIIAVLERRSGMRLAAEDVFVNIAGGVKVVEPAIDVAIALAIASAHLNRPLPAATLALGELGLGGEIRNVGQLEQRLREAARLGVKHAISPHGLTDINGMTVTSARRLSQAMELLS